MGLVAYIGPLTGTGWADRGPVVVVVGGEGGKRGG